MRLKRSCLKKGHTQVKYKKIYKQKNIEGVRRVIKLKMFF